MTDSKRTEPSPADRWLENVATVLLALATVATAWAAFESRQWTGQQAQGYSHATAKRIAVNRTSAFANRQVQIDVATFIEWVDAHQHGDTGLANFYRARFRKEFKPAVKAWLATRPFASPGAPPTPFAMPQYRVEKAQEADGLRLARPPTRRWQRAANQRAVDYMLAVVFFAASLFFAGISTRLKTTTSKAAILGLGCVLFLGTLIWVMTLPTQLTV